MMKRLVVVAVLLFTLVSTLAGDTLAAPQAPSVSQDTTALTDPYGLSRALDDEYKAWAVYDQVIKDLGAYKPFTNIRQAEATHYTALMNLFPKYNLPIPQTNPWIGNVPRFTSLKAACAGGVEAEIANIALYDELLALDPPADIRTVYESLRRASLEDHLPAFQRCAARR